MLTKLHWIMLTYNTSEFVFLIPRQWRYCFPCLNLCLKCLMSNVDRLCSSSWTAVDFIVTTEQQSLAAVRAIHFLIMWQTALNCLVSEAHCVSLPFFLSVFPIERTISPLLYYRPQRHFLFHAFSRRVINRLIYLFLVCTLRLVQLTSSVFACFFITD